MEIALSSNTTEMMFAGAGKGAVEMQQKQVVVRYWNYESPLGPRHKTNLFPV